MAKTGPVGVAFIGAGNISKQYLDNLTKFPDVKVLVIADLFEEAAAARAAEYGVEISGGVDVALNHPDVEIIVNLTIPAAHVEVATAAVKAGKHVWTEKPFSLDRESGLGLLKEAQAAGVRLGCAPDTFLGASPAGPAAAGRRQNSRRTLRQKTRNFMEPVGGAGVYY